MLASAAIALLSLLVILASPLKADANVAFFIESGFRILGGDIPYIDLFNHNLPTIQYLYVAPVAISRVLGIHAISVWLAITWLQLAGSMLLCHRLSRKLRLDNAWPGADWIASLSLALVSWACLNENIFGLREHLFLLYAAPWLLLRLGSWEGHEHRGWLLPFIGFAVGIVATIKPHFLLALVLLEAYWIARHRRLRPLIAMETVGVMAAGLLCVVWLLLHPEATRTMLEVIRSAAEFYPQRSSVEMWSVVQQPSFWLPLLVGLAVFMMQCLRPGRIWRFLGSCGCFTICGALIVVLQVDGLNYHQIPLWAGAVMCVAICLLLLPRTLNGGVMKRERYAAALFAIVALFCGVHTVVSWQALTEPRFKTPYELRQLILANSEPGDNALFITYRMGWVYPWLSVVGRHQADSMRDSWFLPQLDDKREVARQTVERYAFSASRDIARRPPLIVLDDAVWHHGSRIWELLEAYGLLEEIAAEYRLAGVAGRFKVFAYVGAAPAQANSFDVGGRFQLLSWSLRQANTGLRPCEALDLRTWWRASGDASNAYDLHIDLVNAADGSLAHESWGRLGGLEDYGMLPVIIDQREIDVACDAANGEYMLLLSLEDMSAAGGSLLGVRDSGGADYGRYIYLGTYEIEKSEN